MKKKPRAPHSASIRARSEPKVHMLMSTLAARGLEGIPPSLAHLTLCQHWGSAVGWAWEPKATDKLAFVTCRGCVAEARNRPQVYNVLHSALLDAPGKHVLYKCPSGCVGCQFCDGGLASCTVCGGGEGSLPTECPGRMMSGEEQEEVLAGRWDFYDGGWQGPRVGRP